MVVLMGFYGIYPLVMSTDCYWKWPCIVTTLLLVGQWLAFSPRLDSWDGDGERERNWFKKSLLRDPGAVVFFWQRWRRRLSFSNHYSQNSTKSSFAFLPLDMLPFSAGESRKLRLCWAAAFAPACQGHPSRWSPRSFNMCIYIYTSIYIMHA